ncbi:conserved hypothetical protein [uncultured Desulfovibrio sp.]|uniref:Uncharacterized protein n=1 Tax=uncultured Desulfovibrio sp. TaxID=167968 RepID=A0A212IWK7_9BACT|nr:DUF1833 family protein [uncultured Desulfovibrio sp.]SBV91611.1 conserved hypothetical protein [uncultured Desulfovibrio sp.]
MFDADLDEIIREAYASAPQDTIVLHTLEILHPAFDKPARVCRWPITGEEPHIFKCLLEPDAAVDAGKVVDFLGVPFDIITPEKSAEQIGTFTIRVDNIGDALDDELEAAVLQGTPIKATYREYIKGTESTSGPRAVWDDITIGDLHMEGQSIVASGAILDWMFKPFGELYLPSDYPALVRGR